MIARRGNCKTYRAAGDLHALPDRSDAELDAAWQRVKNQDPLDLLYDRCKKFKFRRGIDRHAVQCEDVQRLLEMCAMATGDSRFKDAAVALAEYELTTEGIKESLIAMVDNDLFRGHSTAMLHIHEWLKWQVENSRRKSVIRAAKLAAIELRVPGASLDAVAGELSKKYATWPKPI
jgi:hypothetical protein